MTPTPVVKVVLLPGDTHTYLLHAVASFIKAGLVQPDDLGIANEVWKRLNAAQVVDFSKLGKAEIEKLTPAGVVLNLPGDEDPSSPNT